MPFCVHEQVYLNEFTQLKVVYIGNLTTLPHRLSGANFRQDNGYKSGEPMSFGFQQETTTAPNTFSSQAFVNAATTSFRSNHFCGCETAKSQTICSCLQHVCDSW
jgi:hypothetical protein